MGYGRLAVGVLLGMAAMSSQATAEEAKKVVVGLRAMVEHDTNVARVSESLAAIQGLTPEDTVFTPSVTIGLLMPVGRQELFLNGTAGYSFYDKNKSLDREQLDFTGGVRSRLGPCATTLSGSYSRGLTRIDEPVLVTTVENIQSTTRAQIDLACSRETGLGVMMKASQEWTTNDVPIMKQSDYQSTVVTAGVTYQRPALGALTVFGNYQKTDYDNHIITDGYEMTSFGVTIDRQLGARIQGAATVAYASVDQSGGVFVGSNINTETTTYAASISYRASERLRFLGSFDRSITPSAGIGRTYDLNTGYRLSGEYDIGSRFAFSAGFGRVDIQSRGLPLGPIIALADSTIDTANASLRYRQSERLSFLLSAIHEERTANVPQFEYTSNRIGLSADVTF